MPTTETPPPQTPQTEPRKYRRSRRRLVARYDLGEQAEGYDLLHVLDELEDERARVALREKIWIALILHLVLFLLFVFLPRYLPHVQVRDNIKQPKNNLTVLTLPPDALKQFKPKTPAPLSDKDRQQQAVHPVPERKDLQAMRRAGPPVPKPAPTPKPVQQPPQPAPPQVAQQNPPTPKPAQPLPKTQTAQTEAPKPRPNFSQPQQTPGESIAQAARRAERGGASGGGDMGANAPLSGNQGAADVLSDTLGVDFGPYLQRVVYDTKRAWYPIIPEVAQPPISEQGVTAVRFRILPDGSVAPHSMHLDGGAGDPSLDRAAWGAIQSASPFPPLPKNFKGPYLELRFYFLYNKTPGGR